MRRSNRSIVVAVVLGLILSVAVPAAAPARQAVPRAADAPVTVVRADRGSSFLEWLGALVSGQWIHSRSTVGGDG